MKTRCIKQFFAGPSFTIRSIVTAVLLLITAGTAAAQNSSGPMTRAKFEKPKDNGETYTGISTRIGGDFALQYQSLKQNSDSLRLIPLGKGFNLPTANLNISAALAKGVNLDLVLYLASRHHNETWVKGGVLTIDQLPFLDWEVTNKIMQYVTLRAGDDEINYGDAHFRRSDNGNVIRNPFVGNPIMDAFLTSPFFEVMGRYKDYIAVAGVSTGVVSQTLTTKGTPAPSADPTKPTKDAGYTTYDTPDNLAYYGKLGMDRNWNPRLRTRLTASVYHSPNHFGSNLYGGDRTGSRYYLVMKPALGLAGDYDITANHLSGNFNPGSTVKQTSVMLNFFGKYMGLETFIDYEKSTGKKTSGIALVDNNGSRLPAAQQTVKNQEFDFDQFFIDLLYRFGPREQFYVGGRYNVVNDNNIDVSVNRMQLGLGWNMLESIIVKVEYVKQRYNDFTSAVVDYKGQRALNPYAVSNPNGEGAAVSRLYGPTAGFDGLMVEAAISF